MSSLFLRLAQIVHGANTNDFTSDPISAGQEALASGYSLRFPDDLENLEHQFEVYDALYAWRRLMYDQLPDAVVIPSQDFSAPL